MTIKQEEFDYILKSGESYLVEFKETLNKTLSRELTAFANASGGRIFIGVSDSGVPKGINIDNRLRSQIQDMANNCSPRIPVHLSEYKNILIVEIPEGRDKPYHCSDGFYIRMGANAQKMDRQDIINFLQAEGQVRFEEQLHTKYDINRDFVPQKLNKYLEMAGISSNLDNESILINLGVAERVNGALKMNNTGVLFFTESIQLLCEQATITCGVFDGLERVHVLNRKDYTMDIVSNIDNALHFIKQELRVKYEMTATARRREVYELPLEAVREAVINAVVHRDYFLTGSHVVIEVFDDRVEISNPGGLPRGLDEKDFGKKAVRRNQLIASLLHRIDFVENMGTGIGKIKQLLKESGSPQPCFEFGNFFTIIFPRQENVRDGNAQEKRGESVGKGSEKGSEKSSEKSSEKILSLLKMYPESSAESIAVKMGISSRAVEKQISRLKKEGFLQRIGPAKGGHWEVQGDE